MAKTPTENGRSKDKKSEKGFQKESHKIEAMCIKKIAGDLSDWIENNKEFRTRLLGMAMRRKDFRRRVVEYTVKELS